MSIYDIRKYSIGYGLLIDADDSNILQKSWIAWDFPDESDTLHLVISEPGIEPVEYTIAFTALMVGGVNYSSWEDIESALSVLFAEPITKIFTDGVTILGDGTEGNPLRIA